jgi:hypothetical protein
MTLWPTGPTRGEEANEIEIGNFNTLQLSTHESGGRDTLTMSPLRSFPAILLVLTLASGSSRAAAIPRPALNAEQASTAIVFYAQPEMKEDLWPILLAAVRADLADAPAELEKDPVLVRGSQNLRGVSYPQIISVKLIGDCDFSAQGVHASEKGPLGWVLLVSGKIQPFVSIHCSRIAQVLRPASAGLSRQGREHAMAQAIAHVLIHEWTHIVTQSTSHGSRGVTRAYLSASDLTQEPGESRLTSRNR